MNEKPAFNKALFRQIYDLAAERDMLACLILSDNPNERSSTNRIDHTADLALQMRYRATQAFIHEAINRRWEAEHPGEAMGSPGQHSDCYYRLRALCGDASGGGAVVQCGT